MAPISIPSSSRKAIGMVAWPSPVTVANVITAPFNVGSAMPYMVWPALLWNLAKHHGSWVPSPWRLALRNRQGGWIAEDSIEVTYGPVRQAPFPPGVEPYRILGGSTLYVVENGKFFGQRWGVMDASGRIVIPLELKVPPVMEVLGGKVIRLTGKSGRKSVDELYDLDGVKLPGGPWRKVTGLDNQRLGLQDQTGSWAVADMSAQPLTEFRYGKLHPYFEDRLVAIKPGSFDVFDERGDLVAKIEGTSDDVERATSFSDGFCTFAYKDSRRGALRADGTLAFSLDCFSLESAGHGYFRYAASARQVRQGRHGLLNERGA
ncbi:MAG: hypothetical protein LBO20_03615, partial [Bifidobacteriaceae bacterium]|nr:hypothetical protein [Bifidobacteriaceae bacterium]